MAEAATGRTNIELRWREHDWLAGGSMERPILAFQILERKTNSKAHLRFCSFACYRKEVT
jgi:hypothetical protein